MPVKPLVEYDPAITEIYLGIGAIVGSLSHRNKAIVTTPVIKYDGNGCFETHNTLYIPKSGTTATF